MLGIFKKNSASSIFISLLIALSLWTPYFINPMPVKGDSPMMPLERYLMELVALNPLLFTVIAFLLMYLLAGMIIRLNGKHFFVSEQLFFPPFIFVLICSAFPMQKCMNGSYIAGLCFIAGLSHLLNVCLNRRIFASIFLAAVFFSLASLFSASAVMLLLLLPISLVLLRTPTEWRDWIIALSGAALPYLYAFTVFLFAENDGWTPFRILHSCFSAPSDRILGNGHVVEWIYLSYLTLLVALAMLKLTRSTSASRTKVRKIHALFAWTFFILLAAMVAIPSDYTHLLPLMAVPAGALIANYFSLSNYRRLAEIFFFLLVALTFVVQYYPAVAD
ncbi:MAG: hypothetical protein LBH84_05960 [Prevotellaceae bacterium]|jgi:hypothetical protein|nr:hypothetical protein [Prevotellaceae bacterium]